jgi:flagellar biosynthetic protein FliP
MILAMAAGMGVYMLFRQGLAPASYTTAIVTYPLVGYWTMVAFMTLPMIALMRYHRHDWRHCLEMTAAMLAPLVLLTVLVKVDLLAFKALHHVGDIVMTVSMALVMVYRRADYA